MLGFAQLVGRISLFPNADTRRSAALFASMVAVASLAAGPAAAAQLTRTWSPGNGNWNVATNWTPNGVPNNGADTFNVLIDGGHVNVSVVNLDISPTIDNLTISTGDTLAIPDNRQLTVVDNAGLAGTITNAGTISLSSGGNPSRLHIANGTVSLTGGGTVSLGNNPNNLISASAVTDQFINVNNLIQGAGNIGTNSMVLTNQASGVIVANQPNILNIDPSNSMTNAGILRATGGRTLTLHPATYANVGGVIDSQNASTIILNGAIIEGGTLQTAGTGEISGRGNSVLDGAPSTISNTGSLNVPDNNTVGIEGTISNTGVMSLSSGGNPSQFSAQGGNVTLTGGGTVTLGNNPANRITGAAGTDSLTNVNNLIQGGGNIGTNTIALVNQAAGVIVANQPNSLNIDPNATMTNLGILRATGGRNLILHPAVYANAGGTIEAQTGSTVTLNAATIDGGTFTTAGTGVISGQANSVLDGTPNTINNAGSINVPDNNTIALQGTINNTGTISTSSGGNPTQLNINAGSTTLTGSGTVSMGNHPANRIVGGGGTDQLINQNNTIQGAGNIGADIITINNQAAGVIIANQPNALTIDPNGSMTNTGILRATGATMSLNGAVYTNVNGEIEALTGGVVNLANGATIDGGTLQTAGTGVIRGLGGSTLDGAPNIVTTTGAFNVPDNNTVNLLGTIANSGQISTSSAGNTTGFSIGGGDLILNGGGTLSMGNHPANRITGTGGTDRLVNVNHTIQGAGNVGFNTIGISNQSLMIANLPNSLTIDPVNTMTNTGTLRATAGAVMTLNPGTYVNVGGIIQAENLSRVDLNNAVIDRGTLQTSGNGQIRSLNSPTLDGTIAALNNTGSFVVPDNQTTILKGTIANSGQMSLNSGGNFSQYSITGGNVTLNGGGTIVMNNHFNNRITGSAPTDRFINVNNTIQGAGNIGTHNIQLTNQAAGLIIANQPNVLTLDPQESMINAGVLRATANGTMTLNPGTYTNVGGTIEAQAGSLVNLSGPTIEGGTLSTAGNGVIRAFSNTTLDGAPNTVSNTGTFFVGDNINLVWLVGTIANSGQMSLNSGGNVSRFGVSGDVTINGGGTLTMGNHFNNQITGNGSADRLINGQHTIQGAGNIGLNTIGVTNGPLGTIIANQGNSLNIDPSDLASFLNQGSLQSLGGGGLNIAAGPFTQSGSVLVATGAALNRTGPYTQTGGTTTINGTLTATNGVDIQGGSLAGTGNVASPVVSTGAVRPGTSVGTLKVTGTYTQNTGGSLNIEIAGAAASQADKLTVTGVATLGGALNVDEISGYVPQISDSWTILTASAVNDVFNNLSGTQIAANRAYRVKYTSTDVRIQVATICGTHFACDTNCDGSVNQFDIPFFIDVLQQGAPCSSCAADVNGDGSVNLFDIAGFVECVGL